MSFDFEYTCPKIDKVIEDIDNDIETLIGEILEEACPLLSQDRHYELVAQYASNCKHISAHVEECRNMNAEMRTAAEEQIDEIVEQYSDELDDHSSTIETLTETIEQLETELGEV